ncbi:hypothetical protein AAG906_000547 [Vitis piasezkii]
MSGGVLREKREVVRRLLMVGRCNHQFMQKSPISTRFAKLPAYGFPPPAGVVDRSSGAVQVGPRRLRRIPAQKSWISSSLIATFHPISHLLFPLIVPIPREVALQDCPTSGSFVEIGRSDYNNTNANHHKGKDNEKNNRKMVVVMRKTMGADSGCRFGRL